jgi:hypothetical protein
MRTLTRIASTVLLTALAAAGAPLLAGTAHAAGAPAVHVVPVTDTLRPGTDVSAYPANAALVTGRNATESFQVVIDAPADAGAPGIRVASAGDLTTAAGARLAAANVVPYRAVTYNVSTPSDGEGATGAWYDALVPAVDSFYGKTRNAFPVDVAAGSRLVAWVDVVVPAGQPAGRYAGNVAVSSATGWSSTVAVTLDVRAVDLPATSSLASLVLTDYNKACTAHTGSAYCNWDEDQRWRLQSLYARAALENRVTIANPLPRGFDQGPVVDGTADGNRFSRYIQPLLDGRTPVDVAGAPALLPMRLAGARLTSFTQLWHCGRNGSCLADWARYAAAHGFADRSVYYACDEPRSDNWTTCPGNLAVATTMPKLVTTSYDDAQAHGQAVNTDILVPVVNYLGGKDAGHQGDQRPAYDNWLAGDARNKLWMYTSNMSFGSDGPTTSNTWNSDYWNGWPGYAIDAPALQARATAWLAYEYRVTGELYWNATERLPSAWTDSYEQGGNGDGTLFYPGTVARIGGPAGTDIPIESARLKRMRDGRQDYELLRLVEQRFGRATAAQAAESVFGPTSTAMFATTTSAAPAMAVRLRAARAKLFDLLAPAADQPVERITTMSIASSATEVPAGAAVRLSGRLSTDGAGAAGEPIDVYSRPAGSADEWTWLDTVMTDANGDVATSRTVAAETEFMLKFFARDGLPTTASRPLVVRIARTDRPASMSASASATAITAGTSVTLHGCLVATDDGSPVVAQWVDVYSRPAGTNAEYTWLTSMRTDTTGAVASTHAPKVNTEFLLKAFARNGFATAASNLVQVKVAPRLTLTRSTSTMPLGSTATLSGVATPATVGGAVRLQRWTSTGWATVATTAQSSAGGYRYAVRPTIRGTFYYRVVTAADALHAAGASAKVGVTVT